MKAEENNKVAVVTGSGRINGVGAATAQLLAKHGYNIVLHCVNSYPQVVEVEKLCAQYDIEVETYCGDLTEEEHCNQLASIVEKKWGHLNVLVNCIGTTKRVPYSKMDLLSKEDFANLYSVNVTSLFLISRALYKLMEPHGGDIINISSNAGISGKGSSIAYAAAKGGANTLTLAMASAFAPKVKVNAICPGFIDSSWWEEAFKDKKEQYQNLVSTMANANLLQRVVKPNDVAQAALSIINNPVMTGELIRLNGGSHVGH